jgi:hypothetical protein
MAPEPTAEPTPGAANEPGARAPLAVASWVSCGLTLVLAAWLALAGSAGPLAPAAVPWLFGLALALAVLGLARDARARQRLGGGRRALGACWRAASPLRRCGMLLCALALAYNAHGWTVVPETARQWRERARTVDESTGLFTNGAQTHLPVLITHVAARPSTQPLVLHIHGNDERGHLASYYAYPRLLMMAPALRRFSLRERMTYTGSADPLFAAPGEKPSFEDSQRFAESRGVTALEVTAARSQDPEAD